MAIHMGYWEWKGAIDTLVSQLLTNRAGVKTGVPAETVISALQFSQLYYHLRDYLFFTYNVQGSIKWHFDKDHKILIELLDESYRLQKFLELNNYFLKSKEVFSGFRDQVKKITVKG